MNPLSAPWLELAIGTAAVGSIVVGWLGRPDRVYRWGVAFIGSAFACSLLASLSFYAEGPAASPGARPSPLALDDLSAPLLPAVALLHLLTAVATARAHARRFSFSWSLAAEAIGLAIFATKGPWPLVGLLAASTVPPLVELRNRGRPTRLYALHMALFVGLLILGQTGVDARGPASAAPGWACLALTAAVLIRSGAAPAHCWVTDWFEHASFGIALLYALPLSGVYAAIRLVVPIAPDWCLRLIGLASLATAVYASAMAVVQREERRFFAFLFVGHAALVLVGLGIHTELSLCASLCLWFSAILSLCGFGLTLRALEARFGRLSLAVHHGLYERTPVLAVFFLLTGLASVGFPGTVGFVSVELLVDGAVDADLPAGIGVLAASALGGIAVLRAYLALFAGGRSDSSVAVGITRRERFAVTALTMLILAGGVFPQSGVKTRETAAAAILKDRARRGTAATPAKPGEAAASEPASPRSRPLR